MGMRNDALCCAAEFILETERYAGENRNSFVATVGKLQIPGSASNVIPGKVICSLDCRSAVEDILITSVNRIRQIGEEICKRRNIVFRWTLVQETSPVDCDKKMNAFLEQSIKNAGIGCVSLVSGAGHDAVPISEIAPVAMLFVRCFKGISHNPLEDVEMRDIVAAIMVADGFLDQLSKNEYSL
jgi:allantoate deiminase